MPICNGSRTAIIVYYSDDTARRALEELEGNDSLKRSSPLELEYFGPLSMKDVGTYEGDQPYTWSDIWTCRARVGKEGANAPRAEWIPGRAAIGNHFLNSRLHEFYCAYQNSKPSKQCASTH